MNAIDGLPILLSFLGNTDVPACFCLSAAEVSEMKLKHLSIQATMLSSMVFSLLQVKGSGKTKMHRLYADGSVMPQADS